MATKLKDKLENILKGRVSFEEAHQLLSNLNDQEKQELLGPEAHEMLEAFNKNVDIAEKPDPYVSEIEKAEIWQNIVKRAEQPATSGSRLILFLREKAENYSAFLRHVFHSPNLKYGLAAVLMVCLVIIPLIYHRPEIKDRHGIKGNNIGPSASLQFSVIDSEQELSRPDRSLTENDTIVFRVTSANEGYCSLYIIHNDQIDKVFDNKFLTPGAHDLKEGYAFKGNLGVNTIVMLFSEHQISVHEDEMKRLIAESSQLRETSVAVDDNLITFTYRSVEVK